MKDTMELGEPGHSLHSFIDLGEAVAEPRGTATVIDEPAERYHADHDYVSHGMLSVFRQSRQRYRDRFVARTMPSPEPTPAMKLGTLVHWLAIQPEVYEARVRIPPKVDRRTKEGKAQWAAWLAQWDDWIEPVDVETDRLVRAMVAGIRAHEKAATILSCVTPKIEQSIRWESDGLKRKCRPDYWATSLVADIKTCHDSTPHGFAKAVASLGYHRQAAHYQDGVAAAMNGEVLPFVFIAVCSEPPHDCGVYELDGDALALGHNENLSAAAQLKACLKSGDWQTPWQKRITRLSLPKWSFFADEYEIH